MNNSSYRLQNTALLFFLFLGLIFSGCRVGYLIHAGAGQFKLLYHSVEIEKALHNGRLSAEQKERLLLVERIKIYGESELNLEKTENYQKVYLESRQPPIYLLSACPKAQFEKKTWWFPVVGNMPYLGFFDLEKARAEEKKSAKRGMDVFIGLAEAYSTLGWFKDPVTMNLLDGSINSLTETILHEMTHITLYLSGQSEFNEGLAVMVGMYGAFDFFKENFGESHPYSLEAQKAIHDEVIFSLFLDQLLNRLEKLYASSLEYDEKLRQRQVIYVEAMVKFRRIENNFQTMRFRHFKQDQINNAYLMTIGLYHRHFNLFKRILEYNDSSIPNTISLLETIAKDQEDPISKMREWLEKEKS
jgi:predicted aminopeptidase